MKINVCDNFKNKIKRNEKLKLLDNNKDKVNKSSLVNFIVRDDKCNIIQDYLFVFNSPMSYNLYSYPDLKLLYGEDIYSKEFLKSLKINRLYLMKELSNWTPYSYFFYKGFEKFTDNIKSNEEVVNALTYLDGLSYKHHNDNNKEDYLIILNKMKSELDKKGIQYEKDSNKIIKNYLDNYKENSGLFYDLSMCNSTHDIDKYFDKKFEINPNYDKLRYDLNYTKTVFNISLIRNYFNKHYYLFDAFNDNKYFDKEEVLKNYTEFFIAAEDLFKILRYFDEKSINICELLYNNSKNNNNDKNKVLQKK